MKIKTENLLSVDREQWDRISATGSFFQTFPWVEICSAGLDAEAVFVCIYEKDKLIAGMPGIIVSRFGFKSFLSMPYDTYGGALFDSDLASEKRREIAVKLLSYVISMRFSAIIITDQKQYLKSEISNSSRLAFTQIVDMGENPTLDPPDKKIMGHIRAGQKRDSQIVDIQTTEQLDRFYELYRQTAERHGDKIPRHAKRFFETICDKLAGPDKMIFIALMVDDKMAGAHLGFLDSDTLINWQTVSDYELRQFKSNHLLMHEAASRAIKKGIRYINLGASPGGADGLVDFKQRWGGVRNEYDIITIKRGLRAVIDRWRG